MSGEHPEIATLCSLPWQEAWLLAGRLESEGVRARVSPDYQFAPWGGAMPVPGLDRSAYDVLVEAGQLEEARRAAHRQAAPFAKPMARHPRRPGRNAGGHYGVKPIFDSLTAKNECDVRNP